mgnify:CR=1 FL=1
MKATDVLPLLLSFVAGMALGAFYFGGLWLTLQRVPTTRAAAFLTVGSFLGRLALTMLGFYLVGGGHWQRILACLAGFLVARIATVRHWGARSLLSGQSKATAGSSSPGKGGHG